MEVSEEIEQSAERSVHSNPHQYIFLYDFDEHY